jgi:hypothetical protein
MTTFVSLKAAAENKEFDGVSKVTAFNVDPRLIEVEPGFNRPISREVVEGFKVTMRQGKKIPALLVRVEDSRIILVDGEHRVIAANELIAEGVQIVSMLAEQFRGNDVDRIFYKLASANENGVSPLNQGLDYIKLRNMGLTNKMIHEGVGKTIAHIAACIELAESNHDVHNAINNGDISSTEARKVVKEHGSKAGEVIAKAKAETGKKVTAKVLKPTREKKPKSMWPDWTYVYDERPLANVKLIVQLEDGSLDIDIFRDGVFSNDDVVYWMPAPPPFE